jgi:hypothetical protein
MASGFREKEKLHFIKSDALHKPGEITAAGDRHHIPLMLRNVN